MPNELLKNVKRTTQLKKLLNKASNFLKKSHINTVQNIRLELKNFIF